MSVVTLRILILFFLGISAAIAQDTWVEVLHYENDGCDGESNSYSSFRLDTCFLDEDNDEPYVYRYYECDSAEISTFVCTDPDCTNCLLDETSDEGDCDYDIDEEESFVKFCIEDQPVLPQPEDGKISVGAYLYQDTTETCSGSPISLFFAQFDSNCQAGDKYGCDDGVFQVYDCQDSQCNECEVFDYPSCAGNTTESFSYECLGDSSILTPGLLLLAVTTLLMWF